LKGEGREKVAVGGGFRVLRGKLQPHGPLFRRAFHIASPVFLVYYALPPDLWTGNLVSREVGLLLLLLIFLIAEGVRLITGRTVFGLRDYEAKQISAFTWAAMGLTMAFLLFPMPLVIPILFGVAWVDPLCAVARRRPRWYPFVPLGAYFPLALVTLWTEVTLGITGIPLWSASIMAALAASVAIAAEAPKIAAVDDDFRMLLAPLIALWLFSWALGLLEHL
jgi:hypothetical protein